MFLQSLPSQVTPHRTGGRAVLLPRLSNAINTNIYLQYYWTYKTYILQQINRQKENYDCPPDYLGGYWTYRSKYANITKYYVEMN